MEVATVYGAVSHLGGGLAQMPLVVKNRQSPHADDVPNDHPVEHFWNVQACPTYSGPALTEWILLSIIFEGNALVYTPRTKMPRTVHPAVKPTTLEGFYPIPWGLVHAQRYGNRVVYRLNLNDQTSRAGEPVTVDQDDVLHLHALEFDGLSGKPVIQTGASRPIAVERAMTEHVGLEYLNGALQKHVLEVQKKLGKDQKKEIRAQWDATYGKGTRSQHLPLVVDAGSQLKTISQTAQQMQVDRQRDFQISDIGRALGIPGVMQNQENKSTSWGTGVQAMTAGFLRFSLQRYVTLWKAEINRKLFAYSQEYVEFLDEGLLRGTTKDRYDAHRLSLGGGTNPGWRSVDEVRKMEGEEPLGGDYAKPFMPQQDAPTDDPPPDGMGMNGRANGHDTTEQHLNG